MSMPFYVSPEQVMKDRADYARKGIARGRSLVALECREGIVIVAENPSRTLFKISEVYDRIGTVLDSVKTENSDQKTGVEIVRKAIQAPARQIVDNAGGDGAVVVGKLLESKDYGYGFDAQKGEFGDLVKLGIIDPTKVVRTALQDAASIAGLIITTEATITEQPKKEAPPMPGGGMGGMGGMDF